MAKADMHVWQLEDAPDVSQDRPIEQESDDLLDRGPFVESLGRALVKDVRDKDGTLLARKSTGFVVGLTGSWGLGKSSVLNLLALHLGAQEKVTLLAARTGNRDVALAKLADFRQRAALVVGVGVDDQSQAGGRDLAVVARDQALGSAGAVRADGALIPAIAY